MAETQIRGTQIKDGVIRPDGSQAFTADQSMGSHKLTNVTDPASAQDAATKAYVDAVAQGLYFKQAVRAATTANITLSGAQTIDGVSVIAGDRVLVKNQTTGADNGLYLCASGAWTRTTDADVSAEVKAGMFCYVNEGALNGDQGWVLTTNDPINLGVTALVFAQMSGGGAAAVTASAYRATNQTLTHNTEAAISLSNVDFDASSMWAGGNPTRLTVPSGGDGAYLVHGCIKLGSGFQGVSHLRIYKNGTLVTEQSTQGADLASNSEYHHVASVVSLAATDYVELKVLLELAAGSGTFDAVGGTGNTFLQAGRIAPQTGTLSAGTGITLASNVISVTRPAGMVLLEERVVSGAATLDFTTRNANGLTGATIQSDYDDYVVRFVNLTPVTNNVDLLFRVSTDGGATFSATGYEYVTINNSTSNAGVGSNTSTSATAVQLFPGVDNSQSYGVNGVIDVIDPGNATFKKEFLFRLSAPLQAVARRYTQSGSGFWGTATAVNALRLLFSSGNITGTARIYGVVKA